MRTCNNGWTITDRRYYSDEDNVYIIDHADKLHRLSWYNIENQRYPKKTKVATEVENFQVTPTGLAILSPSGKLSIPNGESLDLRIINSQAKWSILTQAAGNWILSGDIGYKSVVAAISGDLSMVSSMNLNMTSNGNIAKSSLEMMCIKIAYEYMKSAILLTVERDGCCHLLSLSSKGRLGYMQNYPSLVPSNKSYSS